MKRQIDPGARVLRTSLELAAPVPMVVAVTATQARDGKSSVACDLAIAFSEVGYATAIVDASPNNPQVASVLQISKLSVLSEAELRGAPATAVNVAPDLDAISIAAPQVASHFARRVAQDFIAALRVRYDVVVIDAALVYDDPVTLQLAAVSDGVLLAVNFGRQPSELDTRVVADLDRVGARIFGSVATGATGVRRRSGRQSSGEPAEAYATAPRPARLNV